MEESLIWGKSRHFFGGIEPSNMIKFEASIDKVNNVVVIDATLPTDTVIDGQTLCSIEGAVIRKRSDNYPKDEFDGELVATIKGDIPVHITDVGADINTTYYYSAFPYTKQGVYNRNEANRTVVNEPEPMDGFKPRVHHGEETPTVVINANLPENVIGAIIRKSTAGYPIDENDGELVADIKEDMDVTDTNVVYGVTYYYAAFPYTASGAYNRSSENMIHITPTKYKYLFGYDLDTEDSNPNTRVTYPDNVDNAEYTPAAMDYTASKFNYGSWPSEAGEKFMPRPCMLKQDGTVNHYLDPMDYTKQDDGTTASYGGSDYLTNAMMEWPKIWTKRWEENGVYHFRCSDVKIDDDYECWCNYDINNNEIDHFYTSIYLGKAIKAGSNADYMLFSQSGKAYDYGNTPGMIDEYARKNGPDWTVGTLADWLLIQDLLVMMARTTDGQKAYGNGMSSGVESTTITGTMNTKGLFWGSNYHNKGVKVFGMEHWWGEHVTILAGWIFLPRPGEVSSTYTTYDNAYLVKITRGTKDGSTAIDYNITDIGNGYLNPVANSEYDFEANQYRYISKMATFSYGRLPIITTGSSNIYECDSIYYERPQYCSIAMAGGLNNNGNGNGPFCVYIKSNTGAAASRLSCKPRLVV